MRTETAHMRADKGPVSHSADESEDFELVQGLATRKRPETSTYLTTVQRGPWFGLVSEVLVFCRNWVITCWLVLTHHDKHN